MSHFVRAVGLACLALCACGGSSDAPGSNSVEMITGVERFGWDQPAADAGELASFQYAIYVDNGRAEAADVSCGAAGTGGRFACTCQLPLMASGLHTLQIAAFVIEADATRESSRSEALRVVKQ
jgi:hypothetical protein